MSLCVGLYPAVVSPVRHHIYIMYSMYIVGLSVYSAGYKGDRTQVMDGTVSRVLSQSIRYGGGGGVAHWSYWDTTTGLILFFFR